jgi:hypothetical protein
MNQSLLSLVEIFADGRNFCLAACAMRRLNGIDFSPENPEIPIRIFLEL